MSEKKTLLYEVHIMSRRDVFQLYRIADTLIIGVIISFNKDFDEVLLLVRG